MLLKSINVLNYRSIEDIKLDIKVLDDGSYTYGLIGVNEAGKSTILKALAIKDGLKDGRGNSLPLLKDFKNKTQPILIEYSYSLKEDETELLMGILNSQDLPIDLKKNVLREVDVIITFNPSNPSQPEFNINIPELSSNENTSVVGGLIIETIKEKMHKSVFWTAEDKYLISQPVDITQFAQNPDISIPLKNCFILSGINDISEKIASISGDSTEVEQLEIELGLKVTEHINNVWPKHPITITFKIAEGLINFHIKDIGITKPKTADQRSDGFKQFVSFLLTISAQNKNEQLSDTVLLLDEPETHLHPQAQEELLRELILITKNNRNNIVLFATHSNYMIDKNDLSRNYKISKENDSTKKEYFNKKSSTYASTTYEVFGIASTDYHNELYDSLRERYSCAIDKDNVGILEFDSGYFLQKKGEKQKYPNKGQKNKVTLSTYVRNAIHYPQNKNIEFPQLLEESINLLRSYEE